jgi:hypothetical protein
MLSSKNNLAAATSLIAILVAGNAFAQALPAPTARTAVAPTPETLEVEGKKLEKGWLVDVKPMVERSRTFSAVDLTLFSYNSSKIDFDGRVSAKSANGIFAWTAIAFRGYAKLPEGQVRIAARTNAPVECKLAVQLNGEDALSEDRFMFVRNNESYKQRVVAEAFESNGEIVEITGSLVCDSQAANTDLKGREIAFEIGEGENFRSLVVYAERAGSTPTPTQRPTATWTQSVENRGNTSKAKVSASFMPMPESGVGFRTEGSITLPAGKHALFVVANAGTGAISQGCAMSVYVPSPRINLVNLLKSDVGSLSVNAPGGWAPQRTPVFAASVDVSKEAAGQSIPLTFELEPSCSAGGSGGKNQHMSVMLKLEGEHNWRNISATEAK